RALFRVEDDLDSGRLLPDHVEVRAGGPRLADGLRHPQRLLGLGGRHAPVASLDLLHRLLAELRLPDGGRRADPKAQQPPDETPCHATPSLTPNHVIILTLRRPSHT